jgi:exopolyphosphatase/guanosine-5'-triphosphate,3'-diphosphate pyrophosphatase
VPTPSGAVSGLRARIAAQLHEGAAGFAGGCPEPMAAGGTVTSAARLVDGAPPRPGARLQAAALDALLVRLAPLDLEARRRLPGLPPDRADLIVAGLAVLCETLNFLGATALRVHVQGVREGVLLAMLAGEM